MEDILKKVVAVLRADKALASLTGANAKDSRVYLFYRADADIGPSIPGYVTVSLQGESASGAVVTPSYTIAVWARSQDRLEPLATRVRVLLHKKTLMTAAGRKFYSKQVTASDRFQPQSNFSSKTLQYTAGWLEITGALLASVGESVGVSVGALEMHSAAGALSAEVGESVGISDGAAETGAAGTLSASVDESVGTSDST